MAQAETGLARDSENGGPHRQRVRFGGQRYCAAPGRRPQAVARTGRLAAPRHATKDEYRASTIRLRRYFRRMGFRRLGRTPYYALPLNQITPTATELLGPDPGTV